MKYASVCSGVEAASLAWRHMGWKPVFFSEIEPFPCAVLKHRFPEVPNLGDMTKIKITKEDNNSENKQESIITGQSDVSIRDGIDLLVGGTPCQDLSVAGKRKGFAGVRSGLALDYCRIAYESGCRWILWENVPGTFSSAGGRDFATFLSVLSGRQVEVPADGWANSGIVPNIRSDRFGLAWRCLDAQFTRTQLFPHAVPQRRQRLFVVGYLGNWIRAAQVLLEPDRLQWDTPTRFKARERITGLTETNIGTAGANNAVNFTSSSFGNYVETDFGGTLKSSGGDLAGGSENLSVFWNGDDVCTMLTEEFADARMPDKGKLPCVITTNDGDVADTPDGNEQIVCVHGAETPISNFEGYANPVTANHKGLENCICLASGCFGRKVESDIASTLSTDHDDRVTGNNAALICSKQDMSQIQIVRRLTPLECERLMGFPDNWTKIPYRGKSEEDCPDSPRYKACGNSMCVNVMQWIGEKIQEVEQMINEGETK